MVSRKGISGKRWLDLNADRYFFKNGQPKFNKYNQIIVAWFGPSMDVDTMRRSFLFIYLWMQRILLKKNKTAAKTQSKPQPLYQDNIYKMWREAGPKKTKNRASKGSSHLHIGSLVCFLIYPAEGDRNKMANRLLCFSSEIY